jgi:Septum formation
VDGRIFGRWLTACLLLVAGCTSSSHPSTSTGGSPQLPPVGACHDPVSGKPSDGSAAVACSSRHTTETVYTFVLPKPTMKQARQYEEACRQKMLGYLDFSGRPGPAPDWPIRYFLYLPTTSQVADGQSWARCDIGTWADTRFTQVAERTQSLKDVVSNNPSALWLCLDQPYMPTRDQRLTSCTKPHRAEVTALELDVSSFGHYPSKAKLLRAGHKQCASLLSRRPDAKELDSKPVWSTKRMWKLSGDHSVRGGCWFWRIDGKPLPAMKRPT